jgi:hypothetical protein
MEAVLGVILWAVCAALLMIPAARILDRTGHNWWWAFVAICPLINIFGLWVFAFRQWPSETVNPRELDEWSTEDNERFKRALANKKWS